MMKRTVTSALQGAKFNGEPTCIGHQPQGVYQENLDTTGVCGILGKNVQKSGLKSGFTLIELIIYIGLMGVIVMVAGQAFSDSTKFRIRSEAMVRSTADANAVANLFAEDLAQMGAKTGFESALITENRRGDVYFATDDRSSFSLDGNGIVFKKLAYGTDGRAEYAQRISWYVSGGTLYRSCQNLKGYNGKSDAGTDECPKDAPVAVAMAEGATLELLPGKRVQDANALDVTNPLVGSFAPSTPFTLLPHADGANLVQLQVQRNEDIVKISGFATNYGLSTNVASELYLATTDAGTWSRCLAFTFEANETYAVSFKLRAHNSSSNVNQMVNFQPGVDHIGVGLRKLGTGARFEIAEGKFVEDGLVYPDSKKEVNFSRFVEFSSPVKLENACVALTFAFYSPTAYKGWLELSELSVYKRDDSQYCFDGNPDGNPACPAMVPYSSSDEKKEIKAFKLKLGIKRNGEISTIEKIIPTPNNGTEG